MAESASYLLVSDQAEMERLRLQARVWEPDAEVMLDRLGIQPGWRCVDLGCGAMGVLGPLGRRVGDEGRVTGIDVDAAQLAVARSYLDQEGLQNVEVLRRDAFHTGLPRAAFDLVHARFEFAPLGRNDELLREMLALAKPGGIVAIQEPDAVCWTCSPPQPSWDRLREAIITGFAQNGGDFNAGRRMYQLLRGSGLQGVRVRAAMFAHQDAHPYMRNIISVATSLRRRIVDGGVLSEAELDDAIADCEAAVKDPDTFVVGFAVIQVWGTLPGG